MSRTSDNHRPLLSGLLILSRIGATNTLHVGSGTLTGLATRNSDGKKVLVTNLHVMAGREDNGNLRNPSGNENMYQGFGNLSDKVGSNLDWEPLTFTGVNYADVAMCEIEDGVASEFTLHDSPEHTDRKIIAGVMEPTKGMELTLLGARTGEKTATVTDINREAEDFLGLQFSGLIRLRSSFPLVEGDSGSPCLYKVREGVYKMAGIVFATDTLDNQVVWAFPASVAERELGITFGDRPPIARAVGPLGPVAAGARVTLAGASSYDPEGGHLKYKWEQAPGVGGGGVVITNADKAVATFTAPSSPAALTFKLTVTDSAGLTATDTVSVRVRAANQAPRAYAGADKGVYQGATVTLDGSGSSDPDGDALTYSWRQLPGGARVSLRNADTASPSFVAPTGLSGQEGLKFRLTVSDGRGGSGSDDVWITVMVRPPTAYAGLNRKVAFGSRVTLDGSGSSDPDAGDRLTYQWEQIHTQSVTLNNAASARASFTAPSGHADLVFKLTVTDLAGHRHSDEVTVRVRDFNHAPTAYAGANRTVTTGETVTLFGSGRDPDGDTLEYAWTQRSGTPVGLTDSTIPQPSFTAPSSAGSLRFRLTVTDEHGASDTDDVVIAVRASNRAPNADAGINQSVEGGDRVTLDGSGSNDPDGDRLTYPWTRRSGGRVSLSGSNSARATFTAPSVPERTSYTFRLTVTDPDGLRDTDDVTITVLGSEGN